MPNKRRPSRKLRWMIDPDATIREQMRAPPPPRRPGEGLTVFIDQEGRQRRLPANLDELSDEERDAAIDAMAQMLGSLPNDSQRTAALEHLVELHMAGKISDEQYLAERERLEGY